MILRMNIIAGQIGKYGQIHKLLVVIETSIIDELVLFVSFYQDLWYFFRQSMAQKCLTMQQTSAIVFLVRGKDTIDTWRI